MTVHESFRQRVTKMVLERVTESDPLPWDSSQAITMRPFNPITGKYYRGGNSINLLLEQSNRDSDDPRWMTLKQANKLGYGIRKGAKAAYVEYWDWGQQGQPQNPKNERPNEINGDDALIQEDQEEMEEQVKPRVFYATVFNGSDVIDLPSLHNGYGVDENIGSQDVVHITASMVDEIALHVMRKDKATEHEHSDKATQARSAMAMMYLSAIPGVAIDNRQTHYYRTNWGELLNKDRHEVFRAARDADKILELVYQKAPELTVRIQSSVDENVIGLKRSISSGFIKDVPNFIPEGITKTKVELQANTFKSDGIVVSDEFVLTPMGLSELTLEDYGMVFEEFDEESLPMSERNYSENEISSNRGANNG